VNIPNPDKGSNGGSAVLAVLRLARNFVRFWIGYVVRVRPALNRGTLVLGDRWAYGYLVQPGALRYHGPAGLVALAVRALPQPDLVANLAAPGDVILDRKQELTAEEIATELAAWRNLPAKRVITFDTTVPPVEVAAEILRFLST
jgi:thymidylate kinase